MDSWALAQAYPATGDATTAPSLWLESITRTGRGRRPAVALPAGHVRRDAAGQPGGDRRPNLNDGYSIITRLRLDRDHQRDRRGHHRQLRHAAVGAARRGTSRPPDDEHRAVLPGLLDPAGRSRPVEDWFNKYVVTAVTEAEHRGRQPIAGHRRYTYSGAAWHYDDDALTRSSPSGPGTSGAASRP